MIDDEAVPHRDLFGGDYDENYSCEFCGRGAIGRLGGVPMAECPSCRDEFQRLIAAGRIMEVVLDAEG